MSNMIYSVKVHRSRIEKNKQTKKKNKKENVAEVNVEENGKTAKRGEDSCK